MGGDRYDADSNRFHRRASGRVGRTYRGSTRLIKYRGRTFGLRSATLGLFGLLIEGQPARRDLLHRSDKYQSVRFRSNVSFSGFYD